jgi:hypothetical protein
MSDLFIGNSIYQKKNFYLPVNLKHEITIAPESACITKLETANKIAASSIIIQKMQLIHDVPYN